MYVNRGGKSKLVGLRSRRRVAYNTWSIIRGLRVVLRDRARYPHPLPAVAQGNFPRAVLKS